MRPTRTAMILVIGLLVAPASAAAQEGEPGIVTDIVSHELITDIHVWAPDGEGPYPIVYALHGTGVDYGSDWGVIAEKLARAGVVTFAIDYHASDWQTGDFTRVIREAECGYRYVLQVADEYGGSSEEPVLSAGHSIGGTYALGGGLGVDRYGPAGTYDECFEGAPRPDVVVSIAGCHFEAYGRTFELVPEQFGTGDAALLFIGAEHDETCPAWQSVDAAEVFAAAGYDATSLVVPDATHLSLLGHEVVDGEFVTLADDPASAAVAEAIMGAIEAAR